MTTLHTQRSVEQLGGKSFVTIIEFASSERLWQKQI
jgi:hypothetical protein